MCGNKQDVKLELVKLRRHGHTFRVTQTLRWGEGLKTQILWIDRKELANTFTCSPIFY